MIARSYGRMAALALTATLALPQAASAQSGYASTQTYSSYGQSYGQNYGPGGYGQDCGQSCGDRHDRRHSRRYSSYNGQADVPGDYRCDAYWDRGRTDCDARWRDQRSPWRRNTAHRPAYGYGHGGSYGYGGAVYPGPYGRPDVVHSGGGYDGYRDVYGHDHSHAGYGRDPQRVGWCCAEYRSYDPQTGYYVAYSGERVFCG